uniref:Uncharacterized protein n=1 Tax=Anopheles atroparvus TaxID=41427 RepID=A0AAG5DY14_ANOAO
MSEELDKTPAILNIDSEIESRHHPIQHANVFPPIIQPPHRACTSLPLYLQAKSDLCTLVPRPGMEYVPLRTPAAEPYHYHHVTDQTKSLQELQNEVGALLEFRDLVIETFPDLKTKMASSAANSTLTGIPSTSSSLAIRREWEPGIRIRRKLIPKDTGSGSIGGGGSSSSTTIIPGVGGSNSGSISGSSNHSNHAVGHGASSGGAPVGASVPGSSGSSSSSTTTTTTTALNQQQQQQQQPQQQHTHQHHHHHHHHTHTQHGSNSSGNHHPHQQQQQQQHSSSSLIRSRSNSHSGKKEPKSGEGNNGSVIQDSGFSTETSSSKETHSAASSTSGAVQGALILSTTINRLAVETEDELWNLLDVIHRKGSRLREEVDQHLEREKHRATNLAINHPPHQHPAPHPHPHPHPQSQHPHHHHHHHPHLQQQQHAAAVPTSSAAPVVATVATARGGTGGDGTGGHSHSGGSSSSSTSSGNNITIHHSNPATTTNGASSSSSSSSAVSASTSSSNSTAKTTTTTTVIVSSAGGPMAAAAAGGVGGGTLAKSFQNQLLLAAGGAGREQPAAPAVAGGGGTATGPVDHNVQILRTERDRLLDKLSAYEAETFAGRMREAKMHDELETLTLTMRDLQEQLKVAHSQKLELNSKLHDLHLQTVNRSAPSSPESIKVRQQQQQQHHQGSAPLQSSSQHAPKPAARYHQPHYQHGAVTVASGKPSPATASPHDDPLGVGEGATAGTAAGGGLGRLDALLGSPRLPKVRSLDSKKIAAILLETNIVELQRHLLTVTVQNQVLQQRLEQATRSRLFLSEKFEKSKEDLDDLRFQLMEKSIELEGTKAQLRVIESKSASGRSAPPSAETSPEHTARGPTVAAQQPAQHQHHSGHLLQHHQLHHHHHHQQQQQQHPGVPSVAVNSQLAMRLASSQVSTPSMKAMTPVAMDDMIAQHQQHSSSTESAQDQAERDSIGGRLQQQSQHHQAPETPRRRPSKIPLPGTKGSAAPKPPSGRNFSATPTPTTPTGPTAMQRTLGGGGGSSGPSSNRSLTKSTGSLYVKSSDASSFGGGAQHQHLVTTTTTTTTTGSSWRNSSSSSSNSTSKDTPSLEKSRSSSIPIASTPKGSQQQQQHQQPLGPSPGERGMTGTRGTPTMMALPPPPIPPSAAFHGGGVVSSSPLPRPKRDTLTTKVKNCDSLSRKQSLRKDAPNASIGSGQSATFAGSPAAPAPAVRERKPSAGGSVLRHASSTSLGSGGHGADTATSQPQQQQPASGNANSSTNSSTTTSDNGKVRNSRSSFWNWLKM